MTNFPGPGESISYISGASDAPIAKIQRTGRGADGTIGRRPIASRRDTSAAFVDGHVAIYRIQRRNNVPCCVDYHRSSFDTGRPFFIGQPSWVWSRGRGLNLRLLVDRQHEAVGSRYGIGDTGRRQFPAASRGGRHHAKSRRDTWRCCSWGSLFRSGRFSRPDEILRLLFIALVGLGLNSAVVLLLAKFCGSIRRSRKSLPSFPCSSWNYLGRRSIVFDGTRPL